MDKDEVKIIHNGWRIRRSKSQASEADAINFLRSCRLSQTPNETGWDQTPSKIKESVNKIHLNEDEEKYRILRRAKWVHQEKLKCDRPLKSSKLESKKSLTCANPSKDSYTHSPSDALSQSENQCQDIVSKKVSNRLGIKEEEDVTEKLFGVNISVSPKILEQIIKNRSCLAIKSERKRVKEFENFSRRRKTDSLLELKRLMNEFKLNLTNEPEREFIYALKNLNADTVRDEENLIFMNETEKVIAPKQEIINPPAAMVRKEKTVVEEVVPSDTSNAEIKSVPLAVQVTKYEQSLIVEEKPQPPVSSSAKINFPTADVLSEQSVTLKSNVLEATFPVVSSFGAASVKSPITTIRSLSPKAVDKEPNVQEKDHGNDFQLAFELDLKKHFQRKKLIEKYESECKALTNSKDISVKKYMFAALKSINVPLNALSGVSNAMMETKCVHFERILSGAVVVIDSENNMFNPKEYPGARSFVFNTLAYRFVKKAESEISKGKNSLEPLASLGVRLITKFPEWSKLVEAHFYRFCPYLLPFSYPRDLIPSTIPNTRTREDIISYFLVSGLTDNASVNQVEIDRIMGFAILYSLMVKKLCSQAIHENKFFTLEYVWTLLAKTARLKPQIDATATLVQSILETLTSELKNAYGKQFQKLRTILSSSLLLKISECTPTTHAAALKRLEIYFEDHSN